MAASGVASRRKAEELISDGKVSVNGEVITELGFKANYEDDIRVNGKPIKKEEKVVYLFNKPKNVISSCADEKGRETVLDYIIEPYRLYPLGRLDYDSSGLLLITNDGSLTQKILHPKYEVKKTYEVTVNKILDKETIVRLQDGVIVDGRRTAPCKIKLKKINENKNTSFVEMTIHEGRNREIRKMFNTQGAEVIKLHRIKEANITLGDLRPGEYRKLKPFELVQLKKYLDGENI